MVSEMSCERCAQLEAEARVAELEKALIDMVYVDYKNYALAPDENLTEDARDLKKMILAALKQAANER